MQNFLDAFETPKRSVNSAFYNLHDALFNDDSIFVTDIASVFSFQYNVNPYQAHKNQ